MLLPTQPTKAELAKVREIERILDEDPSSIYFPLPWQAEAHLCPKKIRAAIAGNQVGKSEVAKNEIRWHATGLWPDWVLTGKDVPVRRPQGIVLEDWSEKFPVRRVVPTGPVKIRILVPSFSGSFRGIIDKLGTAFPKGTFSSRKNSTGVKTQWLIQHSSGGESEVEALSDEADDLAAEGWVGHLLVVDEPCSHSKYGAHIRGLMRTGGRVLMSLTPLKGSSWIKEDIVDSALEGDPDKQTWKVPIWANCTENGGLLTREEIEFFLKEIPPNERRARELGEFLHVGGVIFSEFEKDLDVWTREAWANEAWWDAATKYLVVDPHPQRAPVALLLASGEDGRRFVMDEYPRLHPDGSLYRYRDDIRDPHSVEVFVKRLKEDVLGANGLEDDDIYDVFIDPRGGSQQYDGQSFADKMGEIWVQPAPAPVHSRTQDSEIEEGIYLLREWLRWDPEQPRSHGNTPLLGIDRRCHNTIWALDNWAMEEVEGSKDTKYASEKKYSERGKDQIDCLRYLAFDGAHWIPAPPPGGYVHPAGYGSTY